MIALQAYQRVFVDLLAHAREELDDDAYTAFVAIVELRMAKEAARADAWGEALRRDEA